MAHSSPLSCERLEDDSDIPLADLCARLATSEQVVADLVAHGLIEPAGSTTSDWRFAGVSLKRCRVALHLMNDLGVNTPGAVLAVELIEQVEVLERRVRLGPLR
jgi:chaperone modulatory protein CbpM